MGLRPPRDPPIEARIVDQHDGIGPMMAEVAIGSAGQREKLVDVQEHAEKPHHGQGREIGVQFAAGRRHQRAAVADAFDIRPPRTELPDQVRAVQIAARLAGGKEDLHVNPVRFLYGRRAQGHRQSAGPREPVAASGGRSTRR